MPIRKLLFTILLWSALVTPCHADITSLDNTFVANDVYSSDFHTRLNRNFSQILTGGINNVTTTNVLDDTLLEADFADEINPRIRTYEGAACEKVSTGLLPVTAASLTTTTSSGTAYPRGYRVTKASATSKTYTASKWTFVDLDQNGNFQYSEVTIGGSTPSVASNSIRLARVSSDSTTVNNVQDLRTTSCANGPFSVIGSSTNSGEPSLEDMFKNGAPVRRFSQAGRTPQGFVQGAFVSYDTATTFKVTAGSAYINGEYRSTSTDTTVTTSTDDPTNSGSGLDTGTVTGGPVTYYVYAVADQDGVKPYSITYSTSASAPAGVTNYQLIGSIRTDGTNLFTSRDTVSTHGINERETVSTWVEFDGSVAGTTVWDGLNIASITDGGVGTYTLVFQQNYANTTFSAVGTGYQTGTNVPIIVRPVTRAVGSLIINADRSDTGAAIDAQDINVHISGDKRV